MCVCVVLSVDNVFVDFRVESDNAVVYIVVMIIIILCSEGHVSRVPCIVVGGGYVHTRARRVFAYDFQYIVINNNIYIFVFYVPIYTFTKLAYCASK